MYPTGGDVSTEARSHSPLTLPSPQRGEGNGRPCPLPRWGRGRIMAPSGEKERSEGFTAGAVVAVEFAACVDGDANGRLATHRLDVVPEIFGTEDEVARLCMDGRGCALDVPVDLALEHHPPLVVEVIVRVVRMP